MQLLRKVRSAPLRGRFSGHIFVNISPGHISCFVLNADRSQSVWIQKPSPSASPWINDLTSLGLSLLNCKIGIPAPNSKPEGGGKNGRRPPESAAHPRWMGHAVDCDRQGSPERRSPPPPSSVAEETTPMGPLACTSGDLPADTNSTTARSVF